MGSIGNDFYGQRFMEEIRNDGILDCLYVHKKLHTGVCAVLLTEGNRCLIPNLGAACIYPESHMRTQWVLLPAKA